MLGRVDVVGPLGSVGAVCGFAVAAGSVGWKDGDRVAFATGGDGRTQVR